MRCVSFRNVVHTNVEKILRGFCHKITINRYIIVICIKGLSQTNDILRSENKCGIKQHQLGQSLSVYCPLAHFKDRLHMYNDQIVWSFIYAHTDSNLWIRISLHNQTLNPS